MWTKDALHDLIQARLGDHHFIVVANREPYQHRYSGGRIECVPPASGMVSALDPILRPAAASGWPTAAATPIARPSMHADHVRVPPEDPAYTPAPRLADQGAGGRLLQRPGQRGPLAALPQGFHPARSSIRSTGRSIAQVNELFAKAVLEEAGDEPAFVFVQDYHFGLLPRMLKERQSQLIVAQFWHIPWPNPEVFQTFPWKEELLDGLLGNDLLGFHLRYHCQNFLDTVDRTLEAKVDYERFEITRGGKVTVVRPFPISIDFEAPRRHGAERRGRDRHGTLAAAAAAWAATARSASASTASTTPRAFRNACAPSIASWKCIRNIASGWCSCRSACPAATHVPQYQLLDDEIDGLVEEINWKWSTDSWRPIVYLKQQHGPVQMMALHRLADFCIVSSLDDGMNLVAKEFVASRLDEDGVLILSRFTGAARELDQCPAGQSVRRGRDGRGHPPGVDHAGGRAPQAACSGCAAVVADNNIYRWAGKFLSALLKFEFPESPRLQRNWNRWPCSVERGS